MYDLSGLQNSTTIFGIVEFANQVTEGYLFSFGIVAIFFIMLFGLKRYDLPVAWTTSSFICFFLALFLLSAGLLNQMVMFTFFGMTIVGVLYLYISK